jgi:hypothetical protein
MSKEDVKTLWTQFGGGEHWILRDTRRGIYSQDLGHISLKAILEHLNAPVADADKLRVRAEMSQSLPSASEPRLVRITIEPALE